MKASCIKAVLIVVLLAATGVMISACETAGNGCSPGSTICEGSMIKVCGVDGKTWIDYQACPTGQTCVNGACQTGSGCVAGTRGCSTDNTAVVICNADGVTQSILMTCPEGFSCSNAECVQGSVCQAGETGCNTATNAVQACINGVMIDVFSCGDAATCDPITKTCKPIGGNCVPGEFGCSADQRQRLVCLNDGHTQAAVQDCDAGWECGGADNACHPIGGGDVDATDNTVCIAGQPKCDETNPLIVLICSDTGMDYRYEKSCGPGQVCDVTAPDSCKQDTSTGIPCNTLDGCTDATQYCHTEEEGDEEGYCRKYCDIEPTCPFGTFCNQQTFKCEKMVGLCQSSGQCSPDELCDKLPGETYGLCKRKCYLQGESCPETTRCVFPEENTADVGKCVSTTGSCRMCITDHDCGTGTYCDKVAGQTRGCCQPMCTSDDDCPGVLVCSNDGRCKAETTGGDCGGPCPIGYICDTLYNQCVLNCPACGPMECCDAFSAPNCYTCECVNPFACGILLEQCCFGYNCSAFIYGVLGICL